MDEKCKFCKYCILVDEQYGYRCRIKMSAIRNPNKPAWCNYFKPKNPNHNEKFK